MKINTNLSSLIVQSNLKASTYGLNTAIERMSTGFKINHAKDNAANYSINTKLSSQISAYEVAEDNALAGLDMLSTATENLDLIHSHMQRLRDLAEQANNGTYGEDSLNAINAEANAIVDEIDRIYDNAEYNGMKLFAMPQTTMPNPIATLSLAATPMLLSAEPEPVAENPETGFIQEVDRLTEEEAIAQGYTVIKTKEDLQAITGNSKYILMNDIDLSGTNWTPISGFTGTFDGNGYEISNLYISIAQEEVGLFADTSGTIKNLGIINADVTLTNADNACAGILAGRSSGIINNCYAIGKVEVSHSESSYMVGGLIGYARSDILNSYFSGSVTSNGSGTEGANCGGLVGMLSSGTIDKCFVKDATLSDSNSGYVGGLVGCLGTFVEFGLIKNSYVDGLQTSNQSVAGLVAQAQSSSSISNCWVNNLSRVDYAYAYSSLGNFSDCYAPAGMTLFGLELGGNITNSQDLAPDNLPFEFTLIVPDPDSDPTPDPDPTPPIIGNGSYAPEIVKLQIGTGNGEHSQLSFNVKFSLEGLEDLRNVGLSAPAIATFGLRSGASPIGDIARCDEILKTIQEKQVEFGATQNRLESVLEEISIKRDNLVSTQSTIRDADIAEESSAYIRNQILQQAAATLMSTANQTPAIALQLL